tara:strand:- start:4724 stop:13495 length:8772 start_codon:yes stop_codon:yes gene_type:complete
MRAKEIKALNDFNVVVEGNLALGENQGEGSLRVVEYIEPTSYDLDAILSSITDSYGIIEIEQVPEVLMDIDLPSLAVLASNSYGLVERAHEPTYMTDVDVTAIFSQVVEGYGLVERAHESTYMTDVDVPATLTQVTEGYGLVERAHEPTYMTDVDLNTISVDIQTSYGLVERAHEPTYMTDVDLPSIMTSINSSYGLMEREDVSTYMTDVDVPDISVQVSDSYGLVERAHEPTYMTDVDVPEISTQVSDSYGLVERAHEPTYMTDVDVPPIETSANNQYGIVERNQIATYLTDTDLPFILSSVENSYGIIELDWEINNITREYESDGNALGTLSFDDSIVMAMTDTVNPTATNLGTIENVLIEATFGRFSGNLVIDLDPFTTVDDGETKVINLESSSPPQSGSVTIDGTEVTYVPNANFLGTDWFGFSVTGTVNNISQTSGVALCYVKRINEPHQYVVNNSGNSLYDLTFQDTIDNANTGVINQPQPAFESQPSVIEITKSQSKTFQIDARDYVTASITSAPSQGSLSIYSQGSGQDGPTFSYTPPVGVPVDHNNIDEDFTIKLVGSDPAVSFVSSTFTLRLINSPPSIEDFTISGNEDENSSEWIGQASDTVRWFPVSDVNNDDLYVEIVTQPSHGSVEVTQDTLRYRYTPNLNYHGSDSFTYKVRELANSNWSAVKTATITVNSVYDNPTGQSLDGTANEGSFITYTMSGSSVEVDNSTLKFQLLTNPTESGNVIGHLETPNGNTALAVGESSPLLSSGVVELHPTSSDYYGSGYFTYRVVDPNPNPDVYSGSITAGFTFNNVNDPPTATAVNQQVNEDTLTTITFGYADDDGGPGPYTYTISEQPSNGTLSGGCLTTNTVANVNYQSDPNYVGSDSFKYTVNDGSATSASATVNLNVQNVPDVPSAQDLTVSLDEDEVKQFTIPADDPDPNGQGGKDDLVVLWTQAPAHGTLTLIGGGTIGVDAGLVYSYTPEEHNNSNTFADYYVWDGTFLDPSGNTDINTSGGLANRRVSGQKRITFNITAINDPPTYDNWTFSAAESNTDATDVFHIELAGETRSNWSDPDDTSHWWVITEIGKGYFTRDKADGTTETITTSALPYTLWSGGYSSSYHEIYWTPDEANWNGSTHIKYKMYDGEVYGDVKTITINIAATNDAPTGGTQNLSVAEDSSYTLVTLAMSDVENDTCKIGIVGWPQGGELFYLSTGNYVQLDNNSPYLPNGETEIYFKPIADYTGDSDWTYKIYETQGSLTSIDYTIDTVITPVNDPPELSGGSTDTNEDTYVDITLTATDNETPTYDLTYRIENLNNLNGTLQDANNLGSVLTNTSTTSSTVRYTPTPNFNGTTSFTWNAHDGTEWSPTDATEAIEVIAVNDPPTAANIEINVDEDIPTDGKVTITLSGSDVEGDSLTYVIKELPDNGDLIHPNDNSSVEANEVLDGNTVIYQVDPNFNGTDTFRYLTNDGDLDSTGDWATVTINVAAVDDPPVANNSQVSVVEDTPTSFNPSYAEVDGDSVIISFANNGQTQEGGQVAVDGSGWKYTPPANFNGSDQIEWTVTDDITNGSSSSATISFSVSAVEDLPTVPASQIVNYYEDESVTFTIQGYDPDIPYETDEISSINLHDFHPDWGASTLVGPSNKSLEWTFNRNIANNYDNVWVDYSITDNASNQSGQGRVHFQGQSVDDPVVWSVFPTNDTVSGNENSAISFTATGTDVDGTTVTHGIEATPSKTSGTSSNTPTLTETSDGAYSLSAVGDGSWNGTCQVYADNGAGDKIVKTITIDIDAVNDPPSTPDRSYAIDEDTSHTVDFNAVMSDEETTNPNLTLTVHTNPNNGSVSVDGMNFTYTPSTNWYGSDYYVYRVSDGVNEDTGIISYTVSSKNDAPTATPYSNSVNEDTSLDVYLGGADVDSNNLTYTITTNPSHSSVWNHITGNRWQYQGASNYHGQDSFAWKVSDGSLEASSTGSITINSIDDPIAWLTTEDYTVTINEDNTDEITRGAVDADHTVTLSVDYHPRDSGGAQRGTLQNTTGSTWKYTPPANWHGTAEGRIKASSTSGTIYKLMTYTVQSVEDYPFANPVSVSTNEDTAVAITLSGSDADGDAITFDIVGGPSTGSLTNSNGSIGAGSTNVGSSVTYTPNLNSDANDSFTYKAKDSNDNLSESATVSITVNAVDDVPVANAVAISTDEDTAVAITLDGVDPEDAITGYAISENPSNGTLGEISNGTVTYTPNENWNGTDTFKYTATSQSGTSDDGTVTVTVTAVSDKPVASETDKTINESGSVAIDLLAGTSDDGLDITGVNVISITADSGYWDNYSTGATTVTTRTYYAPSTQPTTGVEASVTYKISDSAGVWSDNNTVDITVNYVDDAPYISTSGSMGTGRYRGETWTKQWSASDEEGHTISWSGTGVNSTGYQTITVPSSATFDTWYWADQVTAEANNQTATARMYGFIVDRTPTATNSTATTAFETAKTVTVNSGNIDPGQTHTYTVLSGSGDANASHSISGKDLTYTPSSGFSDVHTVTWKVEDASGKSDTATVAFTVNPPVRLDDPSVSLGDSTDNDWDDTSVTLSGSFSGETGWTIDETTVAVSNSNASAVVNGNNVDATKLAGDSGGSCEVTITRKYVQTNYNSYTAEISDDATLSWAARPSNPGQPTYYQTVFVGGGESATSEAINGTTIIIKSYLYNSPASSSFSNHYAFGSSSWSGYDSVSSLLGVVDQQGTGLSSIAQLAITMDNPFTGVSVPGAQTIGLSVPWTYEPGGHSGTFTKTLTLYYCHLEDTPVKLLDGSTKLVKDLVAGDILPTKSFSPSGEQSDISLMYGEFSDNNILSLYDSGTVVTGISIHEHKGFFSINSKYNLTDRHPLFVKDGDLWRWKRVIDIKVGDILYKTDGEHELVEVIYRHTNLSNVVMVHVEEEDVYIAQGLLHHNK